MSYGISITIEVVHEATGRTVTAAVVGDHVATLVGDIETKIDEIVSGLDTEEDPCLHPDAGIGHRCHECGEWLP